MKLKLDRNTKSGDISPAISQLTHPATSMYPPIHSIVMGASKIFGVRHSGTTGIVSGG